MGCSMGGHMAGDLALNHPERFRAVIGLESAMQSHGPEASFQHHFHPRVSKEFTAAMMYGLCSPTSPEAGKRETSWVYGQGAPFVHYGDLHYYVLEHDLTETARDIDTSKIDVFIFSGEYDWSATPDDCRQLAEAIPGASLILMKGLGHFPMSENYPAFREYLLPVLDRIRARSAL
jgi:pimeloyl-ACP methyl ester carboxylesterase